MLDRKIELIARAIASVHGDPDEDVSVSIPAYSVFLDRSVYLSSKRQTVILWELFAVYAMAVAEAIKDD